MEEERIVELQVGERRFTTSLATLSKSTYLSSLVKSEWKAQREDGSYFLDFDPDTFQHVLKYMRHGTYPLFYTQGSGHDYSKYNEVLSAADYLGVDNLSAWLEGKKYESAILIRTSGADIDYDKFVKVGDLDYGHMKSEYQVKDETKHVYQCPRSIASHHGDRSRCGRQCENANSARGGATYEDELEKTVFVITSNTTVDYTVLQDQP
ncbi:MAG: hypothetical protein M1820_004432 [Bogoriella megaspora]|nr:MAG: hypothetical protein M1820_004432 [Bogoriella megaspora]